MKTLTGFISLQGFPQAGTQLQVGSSGLMPWYPWPAKGGLSECILGKVWPVSAVSLREKIHHKQGTGVILQLVL